LETGRRALTGRRLTTTLGWLSRASMALLAWLGLDVAPPDAVQGDAARLMYVHVPAAWLAYLAFTVSAVCSLLYLWPRTRSLAYDRLAGSSAEVGVIFCGLTLLLGSIWGKPIWGTWWVWDARLVTTAILFFLYLGYLALRRLPDDPAVRARRCAVAAIVAAVDIPIVHFSVDWWRTLHQDGTVFRRDLDVQIEGTMAWTLLWGVIAFTILYAYLVLRRNELAELEERAEGRALERALADRRAEAADDRNEARWDAARDDALGGAPDPQPEAVPVPGGGPSR
jgi:heme exporter protein C